MKKISIIIPVYNAEKYIEETLNSILNQKYDNLEIILIDDESQDNSKVIIEKYVAKYSNLRLLSQKNSGAPAARNAGINVATGDYAIFLDSDDNLCENALNGIDELLEGDSALIVGNFNKIDEESKYICHCEITKENCCISKENILEYCMMDPKPGCKIYNLKIIRNNKLFFDDVKIGQDLNFFLKYLILIDKIDFINKNLYNYRIVNNGISRTYTLKILDIENSFKYVKKFYNDRDSIDKYNKYIIWSEYFNYYFQYCKLRFFNNKKERKEIYNFFNSKQKKLKLDKKSVMLTKYKKIYFLSKIRYLIGPIYVTNIYHTLFTKIKGNKHI